jgi:hypothetical protein
LIYNTTDMKNSLVLILFTSLFFAASISSFAQDDTRNNIHSQPQWGPVSYEYVEYYYLPEIGVYYDVSGSQYIYKNKSLIWERSKRLPFPYRNTDLFSTYKAVINQPEPYLQHMFYVVRYTNYKDEHPRQLSIRDSNDSRYAKVRNYTDLSSIGTSGGKSDQ